MKKLIKWFSIFAVIGTAVGLIVAYFCKNSAGDPENDAEDFSEDEDFDLDADLQPAGREYVSLKKEDTARSDSAVEAAGNPGEQKETEEPADEKTESAEDK